MSLLLTSNGFLQSNSIAKKSCSFDRSHFFRHSHHDYNYKLSSVLFLSEFAGKPSVTMEDLLASVDDMMFDVEISLENQVGSLPLPFPGMDKSGAAVCVFHLKGSCGRGSSCPFRHIKGDRTVVCKHWLRGLCKKGDMCEFLHEYDMSKMPECYFYSRFHACSNKECPFLHIDPESKIKDCPWYDRGFCRHGPNCRHRHTRRVMCVNYLCGFCPEGPSCKFVHPRFDLPSLSETAIAKKGSVVCHFCNEAGHKIYQCPRMTQEQREEVIASKQAQYQQQQANFHHQQQQFNHHERNNENQDNNSGDVGQGDHSRPPSQAPWNRGMDAGQQQQQGPRPHRPLDQVTCFKCGDRGHYANRCPKGMLAFLSPNLQNVNRP